MKTDDRKDEQLTQLQNTVKEKVAEIERLAEENWQMGVDKGNLAQRVSEKMRENMYAPNSLTIIHTLLLLYVNQSSNQSINQSQSINQPIYNVYFKQNSERQCNTVHSL